MMERDITRLNVLTDELDKRVKNLEINKVKKEEIKAIEYAATEMIFRPNNKEKLLKFYTNKSTYVVVNLECKSSASFSVQCEVYANGILIKSFKTSFPISLELPMKTLDGENTLKIAIYSETATSNFKVDIKASVNGYVSKKEDDIKIGVITAGQIFYRKNDVIKSINTDTMETKVCYTGKDYSCIASSQASYLLYVLKTGNEIKLERYSKDSSMSIKTETMTEDFTRFAVDISSGITYIICIKGENVYMYVKQIGNTTYVKLPFKAKNIYTYHGATGRYVYYVDLRDNVTVVKHVSNLDYEEEKRVSLGKLENVNLCEEDGKLIALYRQGLVVVKRPVFESGETEIVGIGDEGIITADGVTIIRQKDKLIKL